jgi:hypothetical protein
MNPNLAKNYKQINDILGLPQEYKGIDFYPVKIGELDYKSSLYNLFHWPKNYVPNADVIKMSYIKYLIYVIAPSLKEKDSNADIEKEFIDFISHITHLDIDEIHFGAKENPMNKGEFDKFFLYLYIKGVEFSEQDIDNLREIILEQNGSSIEWVEDYKPDLQTRLDVFNGNNDIDLKDAIYSFCALTNLSEKEVCEKTIFQFNARLEREMRLKDYQAFKPLEISGQVSAKNKKDELFKHYLSHIPKKGRYDDILLNLNTFMEDSGLNDPESGLRNGTNFE